MDIFDASLQNLGDYFETTPSKIVVQGSGYNVAGGYGYENGKLTIVTNNGAMNCYGFATQNKIDLTNFKYIRFSGIDGNPTSSNAFRFDISDEKYISFMNQPPWSRLNTWDERCGNAIRDRGSSSVSQIVVDISDITGAWYFIMGVANTDSESATNTYISKIELLEDITPSGGAGSGYIGNSLLSNKKMVGYNVPTSSAEGTKTESVNDVSASAVSGKPKAGNGFARIMKLNKGYNLSEIAKTIDFANQLDFKATTTPGKTTLNDVPSEYYDSANIFQVGQKNASVYQYDSTNDTIYCYLPSSGNAYIEGVTYIPIHMSQIKHIEMYVDTWCSNAFKIDLIKCTSDTKEVVQTLLSLNDTSGTRHYQNRVSFTSLTLTDEVNYIVINDGYGRGLNVGDVQTKISGIFITTGE